MNSIKRGPGPDFGPRSSCTNTAQAFLILCPMGASNQRVTHVTFSPDGNSLDSVSDDKHIRIWDVQSGKAVQTFEVTWVG
jgi:WD40 repeat protein